jgi:hypothetical protein
MTIALPFPAAGMTAAACGYPQDMAPIGQQ